MDVADYLPLTRRPTRLIGSEVSDPYVQVLARAKQKHREDAKTIKELRFELKRLKKLAKKRLKNETSQLRR